MKKPAKPPTVPYRFIRPDSDVGVWMYALLQELIDLHHQEIQDARIALAWHLTWKPDVDGRVTLGQCQKVSELARELAGEFKTYDFVIVLRQEFWHDSLVTNLQRRALLDHELCHAGVRVDDQGEPVLNECGRVVYRLIKHSVEDFTEIVDRYGCWKKDLEQFASALDHARARRGWVGYTHLREQLIAAGASIPLEIILGWTDAERREAEVWALVQQGTAVPARCPEHVETARAKHTDAPTVAEAVS